MSIPTSPAQARKHAKLIQKANPQIPAASTVAGRTIKLASGREAFKIGVGLDLRTVPTELAYIGSTIPLRKLDAWSDKFDEACRYGDEGPTCSICDGQGHGYPGGPPCPLEIGVDDGFDRWEAERGVIQFDEAIRASELACNTCGRTTYYCEGH